MALALVQRRPAESHALVKRAVIADLGRLPDYDAHCMIHEQSLADPGAGVDLDPGRHPPKMG